MGSKVQLQTLDETVYGKIEKTIQPLTTKLQEILQNILGIIYIKKQQDEKLILDPHAIYFKQLIK